MAEAGGHFSTILSMGCAEVQVVGYHKPPSFCDNHLLLFLGNAVAQ